MGTAKAAKPAKVATPAPASAEAIATAVEEKEASVGKTAIYDEIVAYIRAKTGKNIGKSGGRMIFDMATKGIFATAVKEGTFRFNAGYGSLHVRNYKEGSRRLPSGTVTTFGKRQKVRYEEGVSVSNLVKGSDKAVAASTDGQSTVNLT